MSGAEFLNAKVLERPGLRHAFFTRRGGVSSGVYASLNGGVGSRDASEAVAANRARMAEALGVPPERLVIPYQVHSPDVVTISAPWAPDARPRCDGLVTAAPGLALGVTGADCAMILFADSEARVIGAAHAGWKGALFGVVEATVAAMIRLGAKPSRISAALGPCIAQASYEVGPEFVAAYTEADPNSARFFVASTNEGRSMFDLHDYIGERAARAGIGEFEDSGLDTYADETRFYSYRRTTHRKEPDYGRLYRRLRSPELARRREFRRRVRDRRERHCAQASVRPPTRQIAGSTAAERPRHACQSPRARRRRDRREGRPHKLHAPARIDAKHRPQTRPSGSEAPPRRAPRARHSGGRNP